MYGYISRNTGRYFILNFKIWLYFLNGWVSGLLNSSFIFMTVKYKKRYIKVTTLLISSNHTQDSCEYLNKHRCSTLTCLWKLVSWQDIVIDISLPIRRKWQDKSRENRLRLRFSVNFELDTSTLNTQIIPQLIFSMCKKSDDADLFRPSILN